jgi:hypothetical protein
MTGTLPAGGMGRVEHIRSARLVLSDTDRDLIRITSHPDYPRWVEQIRATGGCAEPVYIRGSSITMDPSTGEILRAYSSYDEPGGRLAVRCDNRRASRCPSCSYSYAGDSFHLIRAGLTGGKNVPPAVADRPRVFATLTAPTFGPVHRASDDGKPCRPRRSRPVCEHGRPLGCGAHHDHSDRLIGQPLCVACYRYAEHTLWNSHVGPLWDGFTRSLRRRLATRAGIPRTRLAEHVRVSFAKVAEYQARGAVHLHAVIRLDGPDGPGQEPPAWATADLLAELVPVAAAAVRVYPPETGQLGSPVLGWGAQTDVRPLRTEVDADGLTDDAVAAYVAKYVTKATTGGTALDRRLLTRAQIDYLPTTTHVRALLRTCWDLATIPELSHLRLRAWAHALGYRGHCITKSRVYSTTYTALRNARRTWHTRDGADGVTEGAWTYAGRGYTPGETLIAAGIAEDLAQSRAAARGAAASAGGS